MKAAVFYGPHDVRLQDVPKPEAGPGEIVVQVAACGVCHTDLHYIDHGTPTFKKPPLILGHETSGTVEEIGPGVTQWKKGDRVLLPAVLTCGTCELCRVGRENICLNMQMFGNHIDGGFAEFVKSPAKDAIAIPAKLPLVEVSVVADAVSTPYHAVVNRAQVKPGEKVVVIGCGGVGINVVQFAIAAGAIVTAVDLDPKKMELAKSFGAQEGKPKGMDVAFECIGNPATIKIALDSVKRGGRTVIVGYSDKPAELNAAKTMFFEQEIRGSLGCRPVDYPKILEMAAAGRIQIEPLVTGRFPLAKIHDAFEALRKGAGLRNIVIP